MRDERGDETQYRPSAGRREGYGMRVSSLPIQAHTVSVSGYFEDKTCAPRVASSSPAPGLLLTFRRLRSIARLDATA